MSYQCIRKIDDNLQVLTRLTYLHIKKVGVTDEEVKAEVDKVYGGN